MEQVAFGDGAACSFRRQQISDGRKRAVSEWLDVRLQHGGTARRAVEQNVLVAAVAVAVTAVMAATVEAIAHTRHQLLPHRRPTDRHRGVEALVV